MPGGILLERSQPYWSARCSAQYCACSPVCLPCPTPIGPDSMIGPPSRQLSPQGTQLFRPPDMLLPSPPSPLPGGPVAVLQLALLSAGGRGRRHPAGRPENNHQQKPVAGRPRGAAGATLHTDHTDTLPGQSTNRRVRR